MWGVWGLWGKGPNSTGSNSHGEGKSPKTFLRSLKQERKKQTTTTTKKTPYLCSESFSIGAATQMSPSERVLKSRSLSPERNEKFPHSEAITRGPAPNAAGCSVDVDWLSLLSRPLLDGSFPPTTYAKTCDWLMPCWSPASGLRRPASKSSPQPLLSFFFCLYWYRDKIQKGVRDLEGRRAEGPWKFLNPRAGRTWSHLQFSHFTDDVTFSHKRSGGRSGLQKRDMMLSRSWESRLFQEGLFCVSAQSSFWGQRWGD